MPIVLLWVCIHFLSLLSSPNGLLLVLHPKYKLRYFQKAKWQPEWIEEAREIVTRRYKDCYEGRFGKKLSEPDSAAKVPSVCTILSLYVPNLSLLS
jgi:hypothetical protein